MRRVWRLMVVLSFLQPAGSSMVHGEGLERFRDTQTTAIQAEVLEKIQARARNLKSLTGRFRQLKTTRLLTAPMECEGEFQWQPPDRFRWDVFQPNPFRLVARGDTILLLYPDLDRASLYRHPTGAGLLGQITGTAGDSEALEGSYIVHVTSPGGPDDPPGIRLSLEARAGKAARYLERIDVVIDPSTWLPNKVTILETSGDTTAIDLSEVVENGPIEEDLFSVRPPEGVQLQQRQGGGRP